MAALVQAGLIVAGVEVLREFSGRDLLEVVAAVKDLLQSIGVPDGEGAAAQNVGVTGGQAVGLGGIQILDLLACFLAIRQGQRGRRDVLVVTPLAGIALVGGDQVILTADGDHRDAVRHVDAVHVFIADVDPAVHIQVQAVALGAVILEAQTLDIFPGAVGQVQSGNGVVLLQGDVGGIAVGGNGDELRLQIHAGGGIGFQQDAIVDQSITAAVQRLKGIGSGVSGSQIHHSDGAHGVGRAFAVTFSGLALVGREDQIAVGGEGEHVGLNAGLVLGLEIPLIVQRHNNAVCGVVCVLDGDSHQIAVGIHVHAGDVAGGEVIGLAQSSDVHQLD